LALVRILGSRFLPSVEMTPWGWFAVGAAGLPPPRVSSFAALPENMRKVSSGLNIAQVRWVTREKLQKAPRISTGPMALKMKQPILPDFKVDGQKKVLPA
jgi:hypothetical protein